MWHLGVSQQHPELSVGVGGWEPCQAWLPAALLAVCPGGRSRVPQRRTCLPRRMASPSARLVCR